MIPLQLFDTATSTYTYLLVDNHTRDALIIDPVNAQWERDLAVLHAHGLTLRWIVETHVHMQTTSPAQRCWPSTPVPAPPRPPIAVSEPLRSNWCMVPYCALVASSCRPWPHRGIPLAACRICGATMSLPATPC